jgi:hypothetical protein
MNVEETRLTEALIENISETGLGAAKAEYCFECRSFHLPPTYPAPHRREPMRRRITVPKPYAGMKSTLLVLLLFVMVGCGGHSPMLTPATSNEVITADRVFSNTVQTWNFVSHCRKLRPDGSRDPYVEAHTKIEVMPMVLQSVWRYTKDQPCAYWNPDTTARSPANPGLGIGEGHTNQHRSWR